MSVYFHCLVNENSVFVFQIKENLLGRIVKFQTERWIVPWTGQTIAQVSSPIHLLR
jgi:hypothetical protein